MKKLLVVVMLMLSGVTWAGDFEDGEEALMKQNFPLALQKFKSAGLKGDANAQYTVGLMYGKRVSRILCKRGDC
jgi:hypothetical protein